MWWYNRDFISNVSLLTATKQQHQWCHFKSSNSSKIMISLASCLVFFKLLVLLLLFTDWILAQFFLVIVKYFILFLYLFLIKITLLLLKLCIFSQWGIDKCSFYFFLKATVHLHRNYLNTMLQLIIEKTISLMSISIDNWKCVLISHNWFASVFHWAGKLSSSCVQTARWMNKRWRFNGSSNHFISEWIK